MHLATLLEDALPKPAVLAAAFKSATLPTTFKSTPVSHVAASKSVSIQQHPRCEASHSDNQCHHVNLSELALILVPRTALQTWLKRWMWWPTHRPAIFGPHSKHDKIVDVSTDSIGNHNEQLCSTSDNAVDHNFGD